MKKFKINFKLILSLSFLGTSLSPLYFVIPINASESAAGWKSHWSETPPPVPAGTGAIAGWLSKFNQWIEAEKITGNPIVQTYKGGNANIAKKFVEAYPSEVARLKAAQASQAQASAEAEKRAIEEKRRRENACAKGSA